jgi:pilus assembly protein CpaE
MDDNHLTFDRSHTLRDSFGGNIGMPTEYSSVVASSSASTVSRNIAPVPRITVGAFCENHSVVGLIEATSRDRLMARASVEIHSGGLTAASTYCQQNPVPNLLVIEIAGSNDVVLDQLDFLASLCEETTRVLLIGHTNDIGFYRELMAKGISEYVVTPIETTKLISAISGIYRDTTAKKLGQVFAFIGAKGGVGSSTVAHNVAAMIGRQSRSSTLLADLDLPFGTAGLNLNLDSQQGILDIVQSASRLDEVLLDRLMAKYDNHLSLLASPAIVGPTWDLTEDVFDGLIEIAQSSLPYTILDLPHSWTASTRKVLLAADHVVITLTPELASLRNAKNLVQVLKQLRPNDPLPKLILNQVGVQKRPEAKPAELAKLLDIEPSAIIAFNGALFGSAANNGRMISDAAAKSPAAQSFSNVATELMGKTDLRVTKKSDLIRRIFHKSK